MTLWLIMATRRKRRRWRTNILLLLLFLFVLSEKCRSQFAPGPLPFNDAVQDAIEAARQAEGESLARARETARESIRRAQGVVGQAVNTVQDDDSTAGQVSIAIESAAAAVGDAAVAVDGVARLRDTATWCPALSSINSESLPGRSPDPSLIGHVLHRCGFVGSIHTVRDEYYERYRQVENHACNVLFPLVIVRPLSTRDVAVGVKVAAEMGLPVSVRSGGHGHNCNSIKNASLHFDLRRLDQVALQRSQYVSRPPSLVHLGPGSTWGRVLSILPRSQYTLVHPQCTGVGVGGFLLGGGVNFEGPQTAKFGTGAENVVEYQLVDSFGDIIRVNQEQITRRSFHGSEITTVPNEGDNDLFFALKGAGSNFGIVTQFVYRIYPFPETRPIAMPVYLRSIYDFVKLQKIAETGQYQISVYRIQHFRRPSGSWLSNTRHLSRVHFHRASRDRLGYEPVVVMFTALQTSATATGLSGVQRALRRVRLSTAYPSLFQVDRFLTWQWGIDRSGNNDPTFRSYDSLFYSRHERRRQGRRAFVSTSLTSASSPWAFEEIAFNDVTFDLRSSILVPNPDLGCDACFWHVTLWTSAYHRVQFFANDRTSSPRSNTLWAFELVCLYDPRNRLRARRCKDVVDRARFKLNEATNVRLSEPLHQSYNTPSCHNLPNERPFTQRYFGDNYDRLLRIKNQWDPDNLFSHCHSIGSTEENCCLI